jgi:hypothetical protein
MYFPSDLHQHLVSKPDERLGIEGQPASMGKRNPRIIDSLRISKRRRESNPAPAHQEVK